MEQQPGSWKGQIAGGRMAIGSLGQLAAILRWKERCTGRTLLILTTTCTNGVTAPGVLVRMTRTMVGSKVLGLIHVLRTSGSGNSLIGRHSGNISMVTLRSSAASTVQSIIIWIKHKSTTKPMKIYFYIDSAPAVSSMPSSWPPLSAALISSPPPIHSPPMKTRGTVLEPVTCCM